MILEIKLSNETLEDDDMIKLIKENFNETEMELFKLNYHIYTENKNNPDNYIVKLDKVYKWIGFSRKDNAKRLLIKYFEKNKDYIIKNIILRSEDNVLGRNKEQILLTIKCFKKLCISRYQRSR